MSIPVPLPILQDIERELHAAIRNCHMATDKVEFVIVLNSTGDNEFMHAIYEQRYLARGHGRDDIRYRGHPVAIAYGTKCPRVAVYSRAKERASLPYFVVDRA